MNPQQVSIARECVDGAATNRLSFPEILALMNDVGLESYLVDYRQATATYYAASGEALPVPMHTVKSSIAPQFDAKRIRDAIGEAQTKAPGYTYLGFSEKVAAAGCAGYIVSIPGRRAVYFGRTGETHVEHFPGSA